MSNRSRISSLLASGLCFVATAASATTYTYEKISVPGTNGTFATGLNASGAVLGYWLGSDYAAHGFIFEAGKAKSFDPTGSQNTFPTGINASGAVTGTFVNAMGQNEAFTYKGGKFAIINAPKSVANSTLLAGLNDKGVLLGSALSTTTQFVFTDTNGKFATLVDAMSPVPVAINLAGSVAGYHQVSFQETTSFVVIAGKTTTITITGASSTVPNGINNANEVVGEVYTTTGLQKSFLYKNGKATSFAVPGWTNSWARAINNKGVIVGTVEKLQNSNEQTAVYADDKGVFSILKIPGTMAETAVAVNDSGQILIAALSSTSIEETYLATPKP